MRRLLLGADRIATVLSAVSAALATAIIVLIFVATMMRYLIAAPISFTEELVGLLFTAMVFAGLPAVTMRNAHVRVTIVADNMPRPVAEVLERLAHFVTLLFALWFGWLTWNYFDVTMSLDARSAGSRLILWPWTLVMPVSCALAAIAAALRTVAPIKPHHEPVEGLV
ncbi:hypothetical protein DLJ53_12065 [Acuticoccus sediminis]|uniref:TRAP transporter small permease protein n=1 Tax=Acuticoccus sediminis TaxID=2184697 RepID=A0A8B2NXL2_9HYPH|nr:TRAP transporter small permease subunit [Acuticoccus sediminis]RAI02102.1 hypothetical protein DLJ53_12065 [Acuticoccus sediminis]